MNKKTIFILLALAALVLIVMNWKKIQSWLGGTANGTNGNGYTGSLVSVPAQSGYTTVSYSQDNYTTRIIYMITFTPSDVPTPTSRPSNPSIQTKEITSDGYAQFVKDYPDGKALGNVLANYN